VTEKQQNLYNIKVQLTEKEQISNIMRIPNSNKLAHNSQQ